MAFTVSLTAAEATVGTGGFDRILVFGVKSSLDQNETPAMLEQLFDAHHYTRGLALVSQGTPTNNTEDNPSPLPIDDPDGTVSFAIERANPPSQNTSSQVSGADALPDNTSKPGALPLNSDPDPSTDGSVLGWYLGVHNGVFQNIGGTNNQEQWRARQMAKLLFPGTLGYMVEQVLQPKIFNSTQYTQIHDYFIGYVRGRGPCPAFRVGQVPYGVLPAISLAAWQKRGTSTGEAFEAAALDTIRLSTGIWKTAALTGVPVVNPASPSPLQDLLQVLALYPSSREVRVRDGNGALTEYNTAALLGIDYQGPSNTQQAIVGGVLKRINQPAWQFTLLGGMVFQDTANLVSIPLVAPAAFLSETQLVPPEFFQNLATTSTPWSLR